MRESGLWTRSGVRLRQVSSGDGCWNWLFVPGGPGLGSESLLDLVEAADVPGTSWLVDLPGDGSNRSAPMVPSDPYSVWPDALVEAAQALPNVVMVGHSTGGMLMLSAPGLEDELAGMVLVGSAPHSGWRIAFARYAQDHQIPAFSEAAERYAQDPGDESLRALTMAAVPWYFAGSALISGRSLLSDLPYNQAAVAWADTEFETMYEAKWAPQVIPTLIVSGDRDRIVAPQLWWQDPRFNGANTLHHRIEYAGHFPWIENPTAVRSAFADLVERLNGVANLPAT